MRETTAATTGGGGEGGKSWRRVPSKPAQRASCGDTGGSESRRAEPQADTRAVQGNAGKRRVLTSIPAFATSTVYVRLQS